MVHVLDNISQPNSFFFFFNYYYWLVTHTPVGLEPNISPSTFLLQEEEDPFKLELIGIK
jgi:hypothetical protein